MEAMRNIEKTLLQLVSEGSTVKVGKFLDQYTKIPEVSTEVIRYLKILLNCKDESGFSPLQISAKFGFSEICDLLINCGADIDISSENCPSPLMLAASNNHYDVARLLMERNANISSSCPEHTAADEAALKGHTEIKNLINDHVVMEPKKLSNIEDRLIKAVSERNVRVIKRTLDCYAKFVEASGGEMCGLTLLVNCKNEQGFTPLQISARLGFNDICDLLINSGADINIESENCPSPLELAASNDHYEVVRLLLERGVILNYSDPQNTVGSKAASREIKDLIYNHLVKHALDTCFGNPKIELGVVLRNSLYEWLTSDNYHPARLFLNLKEKALIVKNIDVVVVILQILCAKQFANNQELSFAFHYMAYFFSLARYFFPFYQESMKILSAAEESYLLPKPVMLEKFIQMWLVCQPNCNFPSLLIRFMEGACDSYPFKGSKIHSIMTHYLSSNYIEGKIATNSCETCRNRHSLKFCSGCKAVMYCDTTCERLHQIVHKEKCGK